jgi:hypothetical protein
MGIGMEMETIGYGGDTDPHFDLERHSGALHTGLDSLASVRPGQAI